MTIKSEQKLTNGFTLKVCLYEGIKYEYYHLYKDDLFVCSIERVLLPDEGEENLLIFNILGSCEERAYCKPHELLKEADNRASDAFAEYENGRERHPSKCKSGWVTKTQYWRTTVLHGLDEELQIVKN